MPYENKTRRWKIIAKAVNSSKGLCVASSEIGLPVEQKMCDRHFGRRDGFEGFVI